MERLDGPLPRCDRHVRLARLARCAAVLLALAGCATRPYLPDPSVAEAVRIRAISQEQDGVRVSASVPNVSETEALFGIPLYERDIQPVWLQVENRTADALRFAPVSLDRSYFSPIEVAYMHRGGFSRGGKQAMERYLYDSALPRDIPAGAVVSGFVFTHASPGTKAFNAELFGIGDAHYVFTFFVDVPGFRPDHAEVDFEALYGAEEVRTIDAQTLRTALEELECCTTDASGEQPGPPLNVVIVGDGDDLLRALLRARWYETSRAADEGTRLSHWDGRPPDAIFRKSRDKAGERNELALWLSPVTVDGRDVWVGQAIHYLGSWFERSFRDPDVDDARFYLLQDLWYGQALSQHAWQDAGAPVPFDARQRDFTGDEYFTDGYRAVLWVSGEPVSLIDTRTLSWDAVPAR